MHTVTLNIQDNIYDHVMFLLKNLNHKDLEIVEEKRVSTSDIKYNDWNTMELDSVGKIGFNSKSFIEDN